MLHLLLLLPSLVLIVDSGDGGMVSVSAVAGRSSLFFVAHPIPVLGVKAAVTPGPQIPCCCLPRTKWLDHFYSMHSSHWPLALSVRNVDVMKAL